MSCSDIDTPGYDKHDHVWSHTTIVYVRILIYRAQQQLMVINQAFTDVLRQDSSRQMYDQLCRFREVSNKASTKYLISLLLLLSL